MKKSAPEGTAKSDREEVSCRLRKEHHDRRQNHLWCEKVKFVCSPCSFGLQAIGLKGLKYVRTNDIFIGVGWRSLCDQKFLNIGYANVTSDRGATGTGKTVTLQILAEGFSGAGVPVFLSDVKGDLNQGPRAGRIRCHKLAQPPFPSARQTRFLTISYYRRFPCDLLGHCTGKTGHPVRTDDFGDGPRCVAQLWTLTEAQGGHLKHCLSYVRRRRRMARFWNPEKRFAILAGLDSAERLYVGAALFGNVSAASVGARSQRRLLVLKPRGG